MAGGEPLGYSYCQAAVGWGGFGTAQTPITHRADADGRKEPVPTAVKGRRGSFVAPLGQDPMDVGGKRPRLGQHLGVDLDVLDSGIPHLRVAPCVPLDLMAIEQVMAALILERYAPFPEVQVGDRAAGCVEDRHVDFGFWQTCERDHGAGLTLRDGSSSGIEVRGHSERLVCPRPPSVRVRNLAEFERGHDLAVEQPITDPDEVDESRRRGDPDESAGRRHAYLIDGGHDLGAMKNDAAGGHMQVAPDSEMQRIGRAIVEPGNPDACRVTEMCVGGEGQTGGFHPRREADVVVCGDVDAAVQSKKAGSAQLIGRDTGAKGFARREGSPIQ